MLYRQVKAAAMFHASKLEFAPKAVEISARFSLLRQVMSFLQAAENSISQPPARKEK